MSSDHPGKDMTCCINSSGSTWATSAGCWKKVAATESASQREAATGMQSADSTAMLVAVQASTAARSCMPQAWEARESSPVATPSRKYQEKLNHCSAADSCEPALLC